jgi:hypothetical protein
MRSAISIETGIRVRSTLWLMTMTIRRNSHWLQLKRVEEGASAL